MPAFDDKHAAFRNGGEYSRIDLLNKSFDSMPMMMGVMERRGQTLLHRLDNKNSQSFHGEGAITGKSTVELGATAEQMGCWLPYYDLARESGESVRFLATESWQGQEAFIECVITYLGPGEDGGELYSYVSWDNTPSIRLERELRVERERFQLSLEGANAGLWDWDVLSNEVFYSPKWKSMLGYEENEIPNHYSGWYQLVHPEDAERAAAAIQAYLSGHQPDYHLEHRLRQKNGEYKWILAKGACVRNEKGAPLRFTGWHIDIHELRSTVEELQQRDAIIRAQQVKIISSAKMSSLGEMAGGIAHEINNPLAIISLSVNQIRDAINQEAIDLPRIQEAAEKIDFTVRRIGKIVRGLRAFSRSGENDPYEPIAISQLVHDTLALCAERFRSRGVELRIDQLIDDPLECRSVQISQVLLNLLNNSYDAVQGEPGAWVAIAVAREGGDALFSVTDSGPGIPEAVAARMLEPFFTTKDVGEGTGLGLSIAKGIVEDHGGHLKLDTNTPTTCFYFRIPLRQRP